MLWLPKIVLSGVALLLVQGCGTAPKRLEAVPAAVTSKAEIPGMTGLRYVAGGDMTELTRVAGEALKSEQDYLVQQGHKGSIPPAVFIAISGGGDNGAYTAGLMNGWTAASWRRYSLIRLRCALTSWHWQPELAVSAGFT